MNHDLKDTKAVRKYMSAIDRLETKIELSITPIPGFIVGLSGTDSIAAFIMIHEAMQNHAMEDRVVGVHYVKDRSKGSWFSREIMPWLKTNYPNATFITTEALGGHHDHQRWADLMLRSTHEMYVDGPVPHQPGQNFWLSGTINATEKELGKYSQMQKVAAIQPIQTFWKSEILQICEFIGVPSIAIENSRLPDCLCGRDDLAAHNIDLIDKLLRFESVKDEDPALVETLTDWIRDTKKANCFRARTPYNI